MIHTNLPWNCMVFLSLGELTRLAIYGSQTFDSHIWSTVLVDEVKGKPRNFEGYWYDALSEYNCLFSAITYIVHCYSNSLLSFNTQSLASLATSHIAHPKTLVQHNKWIQNICVFFIQPTFHRFTLFCPSLLIYVFKQKERKLETHVLKCY